MNPRRRIPVGRLTLVAAIVVGTIVVMRNVGGPRWRHLAPGVEFTTFRGEPYCRRGPAGIGVLRLDPAHVVLRVRHYRRSAGREPRHATDWLRHSGAYAVFNAGQYYHDLSYMGLLVSDGDTLSNRSHASFKALFVAEPDSGRPATHVLDLDDPEDRLEARGRTWREVAQSFMLFDRSGEARVRKSDLVSNRTVVAEDRSGRLLVIVTEGGYTLWELAELLTQSRFGLSHAMSMDGGFESVMCVAVGPFRYASFGEWSGRSSEAMQVPLPAVITVSPRLEHAP